LFTAGALASTFAIAAGDARPGVRGTLGGARR
jgi:hypothetical protein